jgi:hypothetical protein
VPHFLQMSARGIFGRGRDIRRDSTGTAGSLRKVGSSVLEERISLQSVGILAQVEGTLTSKVLVLVYTNTMPHYCQCRNLIRSSHGPLRPVFDGFYKVVFLAHYTVKLYLPFLNTYLRVNTVNTSQKMCIDCCHIPR